MEPILELKLKGGGRLPFNADNIIWAASEHGSGSIVAKFNSSRRYAVEETPVEIQKKVRHARLNPT